MQAQRRGATKFNSSPDQLSQWDSFKTAPDTIGRRADVVADGARRARYRTTTERSTDAEVKTTAAKVATYRVRGRSRTKQDIDDMTESTTAKSSESRPTRRKYQSNQPRRNENQSTDSNKDTVSTTHATVSSRKYASSNEPAVKSTTEVPANHQPENHRNETARKTPTGRRYRIRIAEANAINANQPTTDTEKKVPATTAKPKANNTDALLDEQNYPEHFKALLKSKKPTAAPSNRTNTLLPKKPTTLAVTDASSTRPPYKHKKIDRPNLKLLFPSLQTTSTTEPSTGNEQTTDDVATETSGLLPSTTAKIKTTPDKHIGGAKFSSKIRTEPQDASQAFRSRSPPLVFDTLRSSTARTVNKADSTPQNHRFSPVSVTSVDNYVFFSSKTQRKNACRTI